MVRVTAEWLRHDSFELGFNLIDILARREAGAIADAEHVRVDRERLFAKGRVEHDVGGFPPDTGKRLQFLPSPRNFAAVIADQRFGKGDDILRLGVEQADRLDRVADLVFAQVDHLPRRPDMLEQGPGRDVDTRIGRLGRKHDGDQQLIRISGFELRGWRGVGLGQPPEEFENLLALHRASITSRIE